jgi:hypothetical protein
VVSKPVATIFFPLFSFLLSKPSELNRIELNRSPKHYRQAGGQAGWGAMLLLLPTARSRGAAMAGAGAAAGAAGRGAAHSAVAALAASSGRRPVRPVQIAAMTMTAMAMMATTAARRRRPLAPLGVGAAVGAAGAGGGGGQRRSVFTYPAPRKLSDIMKVPLVKKLEPLQIQVYRRRRRKGEGGWGMGGSLVGWSGRGGGWIGMD